MSNGTEELDNKIKNHEQQSAEILKFRKYLTSEEVEEPLKPWERRSQKAKLKLKKGNEEKADKEKEIAREQAKYRNCPLPFVQLHSDAITKILYFGESDSVICSSLDGTVSFFSHKAKKPLRYFNGTCFGACKSGIACMALSVKNKFVISSAERSLSVWDILSHDITHRLKDLPNLVSQVEVDDRNDIIVALLDGGTIMVWGSLNFELRQSVDGRGNIDGIAFGKNSEVVTKMLLFDNHEIARTELEKVAKIEKELAERNPSVARKVKRKEGAGPDKKHYFTLCLGGDLLNLWRFGGSSAVEDDGAASLLKLGLQSEDIVAALFNSNFKLFIVLYSLGTCKVFSALSGACMREFVVGEVDLFGKMKRGAMKRDPVTGLIKPIVKDACLDCTQRRLMVMLMDDRVRVWNFFAGQEIDSVDPKLPLIIAPSVAGRPDAPLHGDMERVTGNGNGNNHESLTALEEASRELAAEEVESTPKYESSTTMHMIEMSGVEKQGRDKFTIRTLMLGCTGGTVNVFQDKGEIIAGSAMNIFKWTKRPRDYRAALLDLEKPHALEGLSTGLESESSERLDDCSSTSMNNKVLWNVYMDFNGNFHNNGLSSGSGNEAGHGRDRGSYLAVGYSNGTCTVFDANHVKVLSRIDPASIGTLLHGMKLKLKNQTEVDAASAQQQSLYSHRSKSFVEPFTPGQGLGDAGEGVHPPSKPTPVTIDAAVGVYEPLIRVVIGACSDRYLKIFDADSGAILCSMSYIHEETGMEGIYTGEVVMQALVVPAVPEKLPGMTKSALKH